MKDLIDIKTKLLINSDNRNPKSSTSINPSIVTHSKHFLSLGHIRMTSGENKCTKLTPRQTFN